MSLLNDEQYTYRFECYTPEGKHITMEFNTENPCWSGLNSPMFNFFDFLKGCGYVFNVNDQIGVMTEDDGFKSADGE